jgi:hypothetical protein
LNNSWGNDAQQRKSGSMVLLAVIHVVLLDNLFYFHFFCLYLRSNYGKIGIFGAFLMKSCKKNACISLRMFVHLHTWRVFLKFVNIPVLVTVRHTWRPSVIL